MGNESFGFLRSIVQGGLDWVFGGGEFAVSNSQMAILCNKGQRGGPGPLLLLHFSQYTIDFGSWE